MATGDVLYRVATGDTLSSIATKFGLRSVKTLIEYNNAHPGKKVTLAEGTDPAAGAILHVPLSTGMRHNVVVRAKKIPLGGKAGGKKTTGMFKVYVPDRHGGKLKLSHSAGGGLLQIYYPDASTPAKDAAGAEVTAAQEVELDVPKGNFGWFFVLAMGGTNEVSATFKQRGLARDGTSDTDAPLVPYNFWYWSLSKYANPPVAHNDVPPYQPFSKLDAKFSIKSLEWEKDPVNGHCYIDPNDPDAEAKKDRYRTATGREPSLDDPAGGLSWTGHCHNSAPASIVFKPAKEKDGFNVEELEHLGAECYGNFGSNSEAWVLRSWNRQVVEHKTRPADDPKLFGELAATFHKKLVEFVREKKHSLMIDMRENKGTDHSQVWNQALYSYESELLEHPAAAGSDEEKAKDTLVKTTLYANEDFFRKVGGSEGLPADISGTDATPNSTGRIEDLEYRLAWSGGEVNTSGKDNQWTSVLMKGAFDQLFAPRWLLEIKPLGRSPKSSPNGNPFATRDRIEALGMAPRDRYK